MTKSKTTIIEQDPFVSMSAFVDPEARESVRDDYGNTVWLRQKMGLATKAKVQKSLATLEFDLTPDGEVDATHATAKTSPQERRLILLQANVLAWDGPAFERVKVYKNGNEKVITIPFDVSMIANSQEHPIWELAYDRINELNDDSPVIAEEGDENLDPKAES